MKFKFLKQISIKKYQNFSKYIKTLSVVLGIILFGLAIYTTYRYLSTETSATAPQVTHSLKVDSCETSQQASTCGINKAVGDTLNLDIKLSSNQAKMSGIDFVLFFNGGRANHLTFSGITSLAFPKQISADIHPNTTGNGSYLHVTLVNDGLDTQLLTTDTIRISFQVSSPGESRLSLVTSATTIVGPASSDIYVLSPQNNLINQGSTDVYQNIYNIKINSTTSGAPAPTQNPQAPQNTSTQNTTTPSGPNLKDISVNFRFKIQGVTAQPRNSSPIEFELKLAEGDTPKQPVKISMRPQADGTYVGDINLTQVNISAEHSVLVKGPKHLRKRVCQNAPRENTPGTYRCNSSEIKFTEGDNTLDFSNIYFLAGDLPVQNGIVDSVDLAYIRANSGSREADVVAKADLNYDTIVDSQDYSLVINALNFKYDD